MSERDGPGPGEPRPGPNETVRPGTNETVRPGTNEDVRPGTNEDVRPGGNDIVPNDPASKSFVEGLVARGQAARPDAQGDLPPQATHEIVGQTEDGLPILRRRRFRAF